MIFRLIEVPSDAADDDRQIEWTRANIKRVKSPPPEIEWIDSDSLIGRIQPNWIDDLKLAFQSLRAALPDRAWTAVEELLHQSPSGGKSSVNFVEECQKAVTEVLSCNTSVPRPAGRGRSKATEKKETRALLVRALLDDHHFCENRPIPNRHPLSLSMIIQRADTLARESKESRVQLSKSSVSRSLGTIFGTGGHAEYERLAKEDPSSMLRMLRSDAMYSEQRLRLDPQIVENAVQSEGKGRLKNSPRAVNQRRVYDSEDDA